MSKLRVDCFYTWDNKQYLFQVDNFTDNPIRGKYAVLLSNKHAVLLSNKHKSLVPIIGQELDIVFWSINGGSDFEIHENHVYYRHNAGNWNIWSTNDKENHIIMKTISDYIAEQTLLAERILLGDTTCR